MIDLAIIFIYTKLDEITKINLDKIKFYHQEIPIYPISSKDFDQYYYDFLDQKHISEWNRHQIWYWGSDNIFLYWYLSSNVRAKNYLLVEWDTYCHNTDIVSFLGESDIYDNTGICGISLISKTTTPNDFWFIKQKNNKQLNSYGLQNIKKICPLSCTLVSDSCVEAIIEHIKNNTEANKIYAETKFVSIASFLGLQTKQYNRPNNRRITYHPQICLSAIEQQKRKNPNFSGIFHPIKNLDIYKKYFVS